MRFGECIADRRALLHPGEPCAERATSVGGDPVKFRPANKGYHRDIGHAEAGAAEPVVATQLHLEPVVHDRGIGPRAVQQRPIEALRFAAIEEIKLEKAPGDCLVMSVADILDHPRAGAARGSGGTQRRLGPLVLDIFADHG